MIMFFIIHIEFCFALLNFTFAMFLELWSASELGPLEKKLTGSLGRSKFPALSIMLTIIPREALQRLLRESLKRCHIRDSISDETAEDRASW